MNQEPSVVQILKSVPKVLTSDSKHCVTFVSVTQSFNTTTSKLRLRAILSPASAWRRAYEVRSVPANPFENTEKSVPVRAVSLVRNGDNGGGDGSGIGRSPHRIALDLLRPGELTPPLQTCSQEH
ncbi:hypothetical protein SAMN04490248_115118 [Salinihabitans flavidus]|uniref:Uncharacterized protein n=1 Tax=Salinihabitans flavidus TaxID=569882 RepID=A0A1H8THT8_9RHOB|nr:hypothetical protein SAMN04490248_115118 [Salinihabitans flavidus]